MKKLFIHCSLSTLIIAGGGIADSAYAAPSVWSQMTGWLKKSPDPQKSNSDASPAVIVSTTAPAQAASSQQPIPAPVQAATAAKGIGPKWGLNSFPAVAINQKNYVDINLNDYLTGNDGDQPLAFSLTPGKPNPNWAIIQGDRLHIVADKISPEDIDTTQIIYLTAANPGNGQRSAGQITIQITTNEHLPSPEWQPHFNLQDAIPGKTYFVNLANAVNINSLPENDQLSFQLVNTGADWLEIGENGFSLAAAKIPKDAAGRNYSVLLRVTSKLSGKSDDFIGKIAVNPIPQPFQWQALPAATLNKNYALDLTQYINSNVRNDQFTFHIDIATLPHWLSIQNGRILKGIPQEAPLLDHPQKVTIIAKSLLSGLTTRTTLSIPVSADQQLAPHWKKSFFTNPIAGETYRSEDLAAALENRYPHDDFSFSYLGGPGWLSFNNFCHCIVSKGNVPNDTAGKTFTVQLRVHSKASGKTADYAQSILVYTGVPHWLQTTLPDVKIAQMGGDIKVSLNNYTQDDISGDQFNYQLDPFHSPSWVSLRKQDGQVYLILNPDAIKTNEVETKQTVRLLATSQSTRKTSAQLLTVNVKTNSDLPKPVWKSAPLTIATVGFAHVADLQEYIQGGIPNDQLTISLGAGSPSWLAIKNNRLTGTPPRDQIGGPYPVNLVVHSQATNTDSIVQTQISVQLAVAEGDNMEIHSFYDNHQSIVIRGLKKNHEYRLAQVQGSHFDYGPFYSPYSIKSAEDWNNNPFYSANDQTIKTGDDGTVSIVYYSLPTSPAPDFELVVLR